MKWLIVSVLLCVSASAQAQLARGWLISDPSDSGPGSLRAAIEEANVTCTSDAVRCTIAFFDHPESLPKHISVRSPLPEVTACDIVIRSERRAPDVPDVTWGIGGAAGAGLVFRPQCSRPRIEIDGLSLGQFAGDAISVFSGAASSGIFLNRISASASERGIYIDAPNAEVGISNSKIENTRRSAITIWAARSTELQGVQLDRAGASGVFVTGAGGNVLVRNALIRFSAHFGIAMARGTSTVRLDNSQVVGNVMMDLDWGLDGPTANRLDDDAPDSPHVVSAVYDPARRTTTVTVQAPGPGEITLWFSQGRTYLGTAYLERWRTFNVGARGVFVHQIETDLRGLFVSATHTGRNTRGISEPGLATTVQ